MLQLQQRDAASEAQEASQEHQRVGGELGQLHQDVQVSSLG